MREAAATAAHQISALPVPAEVLAEIVTLSTVAE